MFHLLYVTFQKIFLLVTAILFFYGNQLVCFTLVTPLHMKPRGSMLHSQGLSNNPYPELNQPNSLYRYRFL